MQRSAVALVLLAAAASAGERLRSETSPYLRQRSADAVDWRPWGEDAFDEARREGKPVLLLAGEWRCDGCDDVESRLFVEGDQAVLVGRRLVPVAVDRLERPDVADVYATAYSLLPEGGSLPPGPSLFLLTPERRPFAGAPLEGVEALAFLDRHAGDLERGRPEVEAKAGALVAALRDAQKGEPARGPLGPDAPARALEGLLGSMDPVRGGLRTTPKTPPHGALRLLIEEVQRTGSDDALRLLRATLDGMARGGIHDPGAGFFAEAEAEDWAGPRRWKRLADNALLLRAYAAAHALTGKPEYRERADELADFCIRELREPDGTFGAGLVAKPGGAFSRDDRVVAGWNGLMISGLAASGRQADLDAAARAADAVLARLGPARLLRRLAAGDALGISAFLEDYAFLAEGLLDLAEAGGEKHWTEEASALVGVAVSRFLDPVSGGFFDTDDRHGTLPVRIRNGYDGSLPSANGVMASALLHLARATGESRHALMARATVEAFLGDLQRAPRGLETLAAAAGELLGRTGAAMPLEAPLPSRIARGPVSLEATLSASRVRPGERFEARVRLVIAEGHSVNAHVPGKDLVGLSVSVPGEDFVASAPRYPDPTPVARNGGPAHAGALTLTVPLRVRRGRAPGEARVRLRIVFQACDARECRAPESAVVEAPLVVVAPAR